MDEFCATCGQKLENLICSQCLIAIKPPKPPKPPHPLHPIHPLHLRKRVQALRAIITGSRTSPFTRKRKRNV